MAGPGGRHERERALLEDERERALLEDNRERARALRGSRPANITGIPLGLDKEKEHYPKSILTVCQMLCCRPLAEDQHTSAYGAVP